MHIQLSNAHPRDASTSVPGDGDAAARAARLLELARVNGLTPLRLAGRTLLPVVQGGMGVGVSAHRLAGSVAALGAMGTLSSVDCAATTPT